MLQQSLIGGATVVTCVLCSLLHGYSRINPWNDLTDKQLRQRREAKVLVDFWRGTGDRRLVRSRRLFINISNIATSSDAAVAARIAGFRRIVCVWPGRLQLVSLDARRDCRPCQNAFFYRHIFPAKKIPKI